MSHDQNLSNQIGTGTNPSTDTHSSDAPVRRHGAICNSAELQQFLDLLEEGGNFCFRTVSQDRIGRKSSSLVDVKRRNANGEGAYVVVNAGGQTDNEIDRIRAVYVDLDGSPLEPVMECSLEPHIVVQTSPGRYHAYWIVDDLPVSDFTPVQRCILQRYAGDPRVFNPSRVMRLPGLLHHKYKPYLSHIIHQSNAQPYTGEQIKSEFPPVPDTGNSRVQRQTEISSTDPVVIALRDHGLIRRIRQDGGYDVDCPFAKDHTTAGGVSETTYFPPHTGGFKSGKVVCQHAHCNNRDMSDYRAALGLSSRSSRVTPQRSEASEQPPASDLAQDLAESITDQLCQALQIVPEAHPAEVGRITVNPAVIDGMLNCAFWSGNKGKLFVINDDNGINQYPDKDAWKNLCRCAGSPVDTEVIDHLLQLSPQVSEMSPSQAKREASRIANIPCEIMMDELKWRNQRDHVQWKVDMFARAPRMELREDAVRIILHHCPFKDYGEPDPAIIEDYFEHFPELEDTIAMIVASRFASDRKKAYLWMLASTDWGKGFFTACLNELGLVVEMSVKEIEKVFEGGPAAKRPEQFKRAWILVINEFKSVKAEVKQLESSMQIAPKNQLTSDVDLFTKLFLSAENVSSLVTDHGVEDQFLQRFSLMHKQGSLLDRPLFSKDPGYYRRNVVAFLARTMNALVDQYIVKGPQEADRLATHEVRKFQASYGLSNYCESFSSASEGLAEEFRIWLKKRGAPDNFYRDANKGRIYLKNATKELVEFLSSTKSPDEVYTIKRRKEDIFRELSCDNRGFASHKTSSNTSIKAVRIS